MPTPLSGLQLWARDMILRAWSVLKKGANVTLRRLEELGIGIRRKEGLKQYREYAKIPKKKGVIKYVKKRLMIPRSEYTTAFGVMTRRYRYKVGAKLYIEKTGKVLTRFTSMISDRPMGVGEVERTGSAVLRGLVGLYAAVITELWIAEAEHREGDAWD